MSRIFVTYGLWMLISYNIYTLEVIREDIREHLIEVDDNNFETIRHSSPYVMCLFYEDHFHYVEE